MCEICDHVVFIEIAYRCNRAREKYDNIVRFSDNFERKMIRNLIFFHFASVNT